MSAVLESLATVADPTDAFRRDVLAGRSGRRLVFFPGSTIGNLVPDDAVALMERINRELNADFARGESIHTESAPTDLMREPPRLR